ncbi:DNA polymerase IV [Candidatus Microgenomates bacterium]|jgi:DNA polymerase-4|nr:MAG: DNA polymerase IV [Candidatus Microgenomates bacterium]
MPIILHLDMDSFFASVEQQANPALAGRPVGIIKGEGRSCIIAASKEAKKIGIKTGTSSYEAKKICPGIALVPSDFDKYYSVTKRFIEICSRYSPDLEVFSIDELFLNVTQTQAFFSGVSGICQKIKEDLKREVGEHITCSIGISYNRLLAKLASPINKPNGVFAITPENRDKVLFKAKLSDVCGLGHRLEKKLFSMGITNFKSLREIPIENLKIGVGPFWAKELKKLSCGEDDSFLTRVGEISKAKSVSRTFTLYENTKEVDLIKATLRNLCEEAAFKAREMKMAGRMVGLSVRGELANGERTGDGRHKTVRYFLDKGSDLFEIVWELFLKMKWPGSVRFLGVWMGLLADKKILTLSLFPEEQKKEKLTWAMDKVNKEFGELTVYPAVLLKGKMIKSEVNGFLGDKAYRFAN